MEDCVLSWRVGCPGVGIPGVRHRAGGRENSCNSVAALCDDQHRCENNETFQYLLVKPCIGIIVAAHNIRHITDSGTPHAHPYDTIDGEHQWNVNVAPATRPESVFTR